MVGSLGTPWDELWENQKAKTTVLGFARLASSPSRRPRCPDWPRTPQATTSPCWTPWRT